MKSKKIILTLAIVLLAVVGTLLWFRPKTVILPENCRLMVDTGGKYQLSLLYPVLYRLEEQGYLEISSSEIVDGRARNYYAVTPAGRDYLRRTLAEYAEISGVFQQLMEDWDGYEA